MWDFQFRQNQRWRWIAIGCVTTASCLRTFNPNRGIVIACDVAKRSVHNSDIHSTVFRFNQQPRCVCVGHHQVLDVDLTAICITCNTDQQITHRLRNYHHNHRQVPGMNYSNKLKWSAWGSMHAISTCRPRIGYSLDIGTQLNMACGFSCCAISIRARDNLTESFCLGFEIRKNNIPYRNQPMGEGRWHVAQWESRNLSNVPHP